MKDPQMLKISKTVRTIVALAATVALHLPSQAGGGHSITLWAAPEGDATYSWNSKYGPWGYSEGETALGVSLQMNAPYGNDYVQGIIEIPIAPLKGGELLGAELRVNTTGFGTSYWYGSAGLVWLDVGARQVTGHVKNDGLGAIVGAPAVNWALWSSGSDSGEPALKAFDVTDAVKADLAAGRSFSTFVMSGSRDTWGGIYAAESGIGPRVVAQTTAPVPEPGTWMSLGAGLAVLGGVAARRRRR
jgi:hypothetical protein